MKVCFEKSYAFFMRKTVEEGSGDLKTALPATRMSAPAAERREACLGNEFLAAEAGEDGHDKDEVAGLQIRKDLLHGPVGIEGKTGLDAEAPYFGQEGFRIFHNFGMETYHRGSRPGKAPNIFLRMDYHQMGIKRQGCFCGYGFHDRKAVGYVGDEHAVHYVKMKQVGTAVDHLHIPFEMEEIG